jgi:hypothetical protein
VRDVAKAERPTRLTPQLSAPKGKFYWNKRTGEHLSKRLNSIIAIEKDLTYAPRIQARLKHVLFSSYDIAPERQYAQAKAAALRALRSTTHSQRHTTRSDFIFLTMNGIGLVRKKSIAALSNSNRITRPPTIGLVLTSRM